MSLFRQDAIYALVIAVVIVIFLVWAKSSSIFRNNTDRQQEDTRDEVRDIKFWYFSSQQDENPIIKLVHTTVAICKLASLVRASKGDANVLRDYNLDSQKLRSNLRDLQSSALTQINRDCPNFALPEGAVLDADWFAV